MRARTYIAALGIAFVCSVLVGEAAVTRIEVLKVEPVSAAAASGGVIPPYERISGRFYGELDPKELVFHSQKRGLQDHGTFYASKSQLDDKARRVLWGWIPETRPEMQFRPAGWAGCMSLPRELTLDSAGNLVMKVLPELEELRTSEWTLPGKEQGVDARQTAMGKTKLSEATTEIELHIAPKPFQMELSDGHKTVVSLMYDPAKAGQELQVGTQFASLPAADLTEHEIHM